MASSIVVPTTPPAIPAQIVVTDDGADVLLVLRLTPDDCLDVLLRALGVIGRIKRAAAP